MGKNKDRQLKANQEEAVVLFPVYYSKKLELALMLLQEKKILVI